MGQHWRGFCALLEPMKFFSLKMIRNISALRCQILREQTYAVDATADGDDAIFKLSITDYDAVILDVMIPGHDGFVCA
jgi:two-component system response regulator MprA